MDERRMAEITRGQIAKYLQSEWWSDTPPLDTQVPTWASANSKFIPTTGPIFGAPMVLQPGADVDNYVPIDVGTAGLTWPVANRLVFSDTAPRIITGFSATSVPDGKFYLVTNVATAGNTITLKHANTSSSVNNRIENASGADIVLDQFETALLWYDMITIVHKRWRMAQIGAPPGATNVVKSADETVNNSAVLQNDDELKFAITASQTCIFEILLWATGATAADIQFGFSSPAGCVVNYEVIAQSSTATSGTGALAITSDLYAGGGSAGTAGTSASDTAILIKGIAVNSTTAGTVTLQWAQAVATVSDTKVRANSWLRAEAV